VIGDFELIPYGDLAAVPVAAEWLRARLEVFERMYDATGVFAQFKGEPLGSPPPEELLGPLRRAVLMGILAGSPALDDEGAAGWTAVTSDNAVAYVHPIPQAGRIAVETGHIVRTLRSGDVESRRGGIPKPAELHEPIAPPEPDDAIADAMFQALTAGTEEARRLALAVDWLDVVWRNTEAISQGLRIPAIIAGFEALLMDGEKADSRAMAYAYDRFRGEPEKRTRSFNNLAGRQTSAEFSDPAWWLFSCSLLRNRIAHGDALGAQDYVDENGRPHLAIGEPRLREAILVAAGNITGIDDLLLDSFSRHIQRATAQWIRGRRDRPESGQDKLS
jgi:hypothetical protein